MSRALIILQSAADRAKAANWAAKAPVGTRVEWKAPKRSLPQNDKLYAMLTDVAQQATHNGRKYDVQTWKILFMHAVGREVQFVPALEGQGFIPIGQSSSDLSREEFTELLDFVDAWCAQHGIALHGPQEKAVA